ncbi:hypothetical protein FRB98_005328, partial [Tulasnella sp. 332]
MLSSGRATLLDARSWYGIIVRHAQLVALRVVGNKRDQDDRRTVGEDEGFALAKELKMPQFFEVSARTKERIQDMQNHM